MRVSQFALVAVATAGLASTAFADGFVAYDQAYGIGTGGGGLFSDAIPGQYWGQQVADDFVLGVDTSVNGVSWVGSSEFFSFPDLANFSDFRIQIFEDSGLGTPGAAVVDITVPTADTSPTFLETGFSGADVYAQSVKFDPVDLSGSSTYYVSIGSVNLDPGGDGWVWANSAVIVNDLIYGDLFDGGGYAPLTGFGDMAFSIQGVPAPGALALLGIAGLAGSRRRRA